MRDNKITQGTIIHGIRSKKYQGIPCHGIVISARCDLEQCKVSTMYLLSALTIDQWFDQTGFIDSIAKISTEKANALKSSLEKENIEFSVFEKYTIDDMQKVIEKEIASTKGRVSLIKKCKDWVEWRDATTDQYENEENRSNILKKAKELLGEILGGRTISHNSRLCFIPDNAFQTDFKTFDLREVIQYLEKTKDKESIYYGNAKKLINEMSAEDASNVRIILSNAMGDSGKGLIVDLQDVIPCSKEDGEEIIENRYDGKVLTDEERTKVNERFFLESSDDFVTIIGEIKSPWIEWLLQKFGLSFMRIGVDDIKKDDVVEYFLKTIEKSEKK
jgi:hypothetical protein